MSGRYALRTRKSSTAAVNRPCKPLPKVSPRAAQLKASTKTAPQHAPGMTPPRMIARSRSELWGSSDEEPFSTHFVPYSLPLSANGQLPSWVYDLPEVPQVNCQLRQATWNDFDSDDETEGEEADAPAANEE
ncbi:uncharacterized protein SCHCODRAFT_02750639 [Schizophyllum commune H4-8]|nr:uncharacterized protein SCHCODRAFT_02750639 [Schizophyllum commune H4-8]KAI5889006.1 hypothetical protein SCHCODRAFT_02750639 [Schizophyllum commune H4-8]